MIGVVFASVTAQPSPSPGRGEPNPLDVSPGLPGFLTLFVLAVVVAILAVDMTRRIRRLRYGAERRSGQQSANTPRDAAGNDAAGTDGGPSDEV